MQKHIFGIAIICFLLSSCCEDSAGVLIDLALPEGEPMPCDASNATPYQNSFSIENGTYLPLIHASKNSVAVCITQNGLAWYDFQAQKLLAETASVVAQKAFSYPSYIHTNGNLVCSASATGIAVLDMEAQKLVWERNLADCTLNGSDLTGVGNRFFAVGKMMDSDNIQYETIYGGNMETGENFGRVLDPKYSRQLSNNWMGYGSVNKIKAFMGRNNEAYLLISFSEPSDNYKTLNFVGLYNLDHQTWVYERKPLSQTPLMTSVLGMEVSAGESARFALGDSLFVWDVITGSLTASFQLPMGNHGQNLKGNSIWSNERYSLIKTDDREILAYDNQSNALLYRTSNLNGYNVWINFDQNLFFVPSYDGCKVFELSTGLELLTIQPPCENNAKAKFSEAVVCWAGNNGTTRIALKSETSSYLYEIKE